MTRWARANNIHKHKPASATPWSQLRAGRQAAGGRGSSAAGNEVALRRTQPSGSAVKKPASKKKEYVNEDVNGFLEYLQQSGQQLPEGPEGEQELRKDVQIALKKDKRREDRRVKRQSNRKNTMVSDLNGIPQVPESQRS